MEEAGLPLEVGDQLGGVHVRAVLSSALPKLEEPLLDISWLRAPHRQHLPSMSAECVPLLTIVHFVQWLVGLLVPVHTPHAKHW